MPMYNGPSQLLPLTKFAEFEFNVLKGKGAWIILFYADWNDVCITTMPLWAKMSMEYTSNK